jgi:hypothetical protein
MSSSLKEAVVTEIIKARNRARRMEEELFGLIFIIVSLFSI